MREIAFPADYARSVKASKTNRTCGWWSEQLWTVFKRKSVLDTLLSGRSVKYVNSRQVYGRHHGNCHINDRLPIMAEVLARFTKRASHAPTTHYNPFASIEQPLTTESANVSNSRRAYFPPAFNLVTNPSKSYRWITFSRQMC